VTARDAPAHERALRTLLSWDVEIDEAFFLGGLPKEDVLKVFQPDFFFDDQLRNCEPSAPFLPTGHVVSGIANEPNL
jgi:5'-nucleotidase